MFPLRQSTAGQEVPLGYFVDSLDGDSEEGSLTISNTDIKLWKNGATAVVDKNSGGATNMAGGLYYAVLDAVDTDTLGPLVLFVHETGSLAVRLECVVLPAVVYDSLISGSDNLHVDLTQIAGSAVNTSSAQLGVNAVSAGGTAWGSGAITAASIASGALTSAKFAAGAFDAVWTVAGRTLTSFGTLVADIWSHATRVLTSGANIVLAKGVGLTGLNDLDAAGVRSAVGLSAANLSTRLDTIDAGQATISAKLGTPGNLGGGANVADNLLDMAGATFATGTDSLEAIRNRGDAAWVDAGGAPPDLFITTTIATLAAQDDFTLTAGAPDNGAYNGAMVVITDSVTATQKARGVVQTYTGGTNRVQLVADPGVFTIAVGDTVSVFASPNATASLDGASIRAALGMDAADLDDQLAGLDALMTQIIEGSGGVTTVPASEGGASSPAAICSAALTLAGGKSITSFLDGSVEAQLSVTHYNRLRDAVTAAAEWSHATTRAGPLVALVDAPLHWTYEYPLPAECLRVIEVMDADGDTIESYDIEGRSILADDEQVYVRYVRQVTDTTAWSPLFVEAVVARLAAEFAIPLSSSRTLHEQLMRLYAAKIEEAETIDNMSLTSQEVLNSSRSKYRR